LFYEVVDVQGSVLMRISLEGGAPTETARSKDRLGALSPDNRSSFMVERGAGPESTLRFFAANGRLMGEAALPPGFNPAFAAYAANGKYIIGQTANAVAPIKLVAVAGGPIHQLTRGDVYDWPGGWSDGGDSSYVMTEEQGHPAVAIVTRNGATSRTIRVPEDAPVTTYIGLKDGYLVYRAGERRTAAEWRLMAMSLENGSRKELARGVMVGGGNICCFPKPAGGMYYGITGSEFYFRQLVGNRLQIRAMRVSGQSRLLGDFPASLLGKTGFALYQDRIAYLEPVKDSVRLQMVTGAGRPPKTLDTFGKGGVEFAWSHDGRQLAVSVGNPWKLLVYRFDAAGALQGSPQTITLPFEYWYETFWLPDGSGLTMIAQPRG
jgi:hypothetical protein